MKLIDLIKIQTNDRDVALETAQKLMSARDLAKEVQRIYKDNKTCSALAYQLAVEVLKG